MNLLSSDEIEVYINNLDLANNADKALVFAGLNTLSYDLYVTTVSALAASVLNFNTLLALPTISDYTVTLLLSKELNETDETVIAYNYKGIIIPSLPGYNALKVKYIGSYKDYISKTITTLNSYFVTPVMIYDNGTYGFDSYDAAMAFYLKQVKTDTVSALITTIKEYFDLNKTQLTGMSTWNFKETSIGKAVLSLQTEYVFFSSSATKRNFSSTYASILSWIIQQRYLLTSPSNFDSSMSRVSLIAAKNVNADKTKYNGSGKIITDKLTTTWVDKGITDSVFDAKVFDTMFIRELYSIDLGESSKYLAFYQELCTLTYAAMITISQLVQSAFESYYEDQKNAATIINSGNI